MSRLKITVALTIVALIVVQGHVEATQMRRVKYQQHEFHSDLVDREAPISTLVYDIPHFGACGIFPPRHIVNQIFSSGGGDGGMSSGTSWVPFEITEKEYQELVATIVQLDPKTLGDDARFKYVKFEFDNAFDDIRYRSPWQMAVCEKHRAEYHIKLSRIRGSGT